MSRILSKAGGKGKGESGKAAPPATQPDKPALRDGAVIGCVGMRVLDFRWGYRGRIIEAAPAHAVLLWDKGETVARPWDGVWCSLASPAKTETSPRETLTARLMRFATLVESMHMSVGDAPVDDQLQAEAGDALARAEAKLWALVRWCAINAKGV